MDVEEHIAVVAAEGKQLLDAALQAGWDAQVPTCPEWTVRDLVRHVGEVHRWAASHVELALQQLNRESFATWPERDDELASWFQQGHAQLVSTLSSAAPDIDCWSFLPGPRGLRFWSRRQAHETTMHRVDAESAAGEPSAITPALAADGIDEVVHGFFARRPSRFRSDDPYSFTLAATDLDRRWLVRVADDGCTAVDGESDGTVIRGAASDLYLLIWNRRPLEGLRVEGDPAGLAHWRANANIRWGL